MYVPVHFEESKLTVLHDLIVAHPLATLVTMSSSGINANHIPLHLAKNEGPYGTLQGHVARANPVWSDLDNDVETTGAWESGAYMELCNCACLRYAACY